MPRLYRTQPDDAFKPRKSSPRPSHRRQRPRRVYKAGLPSRVVSASLIILLLATQTPATPRVLGAVASQARWELALWLQTGGLQRMLRAVLPPQSRAGRQERQEDRDARVARLRVSPEQVNIAVGGQVFFNAVAFDKDGASMGGVSYTWEASDAGRGGGAVISPDGVFTATAPGHYRVTAHGAGRKDQVDVTVVEPPAGGGRKSPSRATTLSTRDLPQTSSDSSRPGAGPQKRRSSPRLKGGAIITKASLRYAEPVGAAAPEPAPTAGEDPYGWNHDNYMTADDPGNQVGDPPGTPVDGGAGSGNFQITAPVLGLPGRGADLALSLAYNSRLWHKEGPNITYDIDRGFPAPGWSLGFGKMIDIGNGGTLIIEPDGTRHGFNGQLIPGGGVSFFQGRTTDGSFIDYDCTVDSTGLRAGTSKLPNGSVIHYAAPGAGAIYPTRITDQHGNFISISYRNNVGPQIDTITDTLGRAVTFKYDSNNLLTAVAAPGFGGGPERIVLRLHYQQMAVTAGFAGLNRHVRDAAPWQLDAVYYPSTGTGYWFGDSDSYAGAHGMLAKVVEQRGMGFTGDVTLPEMGAVTQGTMTRQGVYHWLTPASDAPTYDTLTETWDGMDTAPSVTTYDVHANASPRTTTVLLPGGGKSVQYSHNAPGQYNDGMVFKDETYDADGATVLTRSTVEWQKGDYDSPRPAVLTETTRAKDGVEITTGTEFTYAPAPSYNQAVEVRSYDYGYVAGAANALLRKTVTQFENSPNYTGRHIFSLPKVVEVYGGDGVRASRVEYQYDGATLQNAPGVTHHDMAYNPYAPQFWIPERCIPNCGSWGCSGQTCTPGRYETAYKQANAYRGNVTQVTTYSDASADPAAGAVVETQTYDITGNVVTASSSCCEKTSYTYTVATQFAYPTSESRGSSDPASAVRVGAGATYDFNTGLILTATDAGGRTSSKTYDPLSLRPQEEVLPTGARTTYAFDDASMKVTMTTLLAAGGAVAAKSTLYLNGVGRVKREEALGAPEAPTWAESVLDVVETKYDVLGRVWKQSRPYRKGVETGELFTTTTYDALGRVASVEEPDGSLTQAFYNDLHPAHPRPSAASAAPGETSLVVDPWGRERWGRTDALGRFVEVVEPDPDGAGGVTNNGLRTTYGYDSLGRLTDVFQGAQHRKFAFDSLGRLVRQKLSETDAVFDAGGQYVGPGAAGAVWGDLFAYDTRSNLVSRTDARNVKTTFRYADALDNPDPLNRLLKVEYAVQTGTIPAADTITFAYETANDLTRVKSITTADAVTQEARVTEEFRYDPESRVDQQTVTLAGRGSHPFVTNYTFDNLGRVTDITYPKQYPSPARKTVHHDYDVASRLSGVTVGGAAYASQFDYNASGQTKELKVGAAGGNQVTEKYVYDPATGLISEQRAYRGSDENQNRLIHLSYDYLRPQTTTGRTGQVTKVYDHLNQEKGRAYSYDALGRLKHAAGGDPAATPLWTQSYSYDRYGNRNGVTSSGHTAGLKPPADPSVKMPAVELAANVLPKPPEFMRGKTRDAVTDTPGAPLLSAAAARGLAPPPVVPTGLTATAASAAQVGLSWDAPAGGAHHYEVERGQSLSGSFTFVGTTADTAFADTSVTDGAAYLYRVRAVDSAGGRSAPSNVALGAAFTFTDAPLVAGVTAIKAQHVTELRQAVNTVRGVAGLAAATWTDPTLTPQVTPLRAVHIQELRDRLNEALAALQIATSPFTDPVLEAGGTPARKAHVDELRQRASRGQSASVGGSTPTPVPTDGHTSLSFDPATNRVNSAGWEYDAAGNQTRVRVGENAWHRYEYDAANRLVAVKTDAGAFIVSYGYGHNNARLVAHEGATRAYYAWDGGSVVAEYAEADGTASAASPHWATSYVYLGGRLLATQQPNGAGGERVEYHHPDRLGTRVVSNSADATFYEQPTLPFGAAMGAEFAGRGFTSYDRSGSTGLDYAVNRSYDSRQGRFTQVDPLEMDAADMDDPQSMNMYAYCDNDPANSLDPDGLWNPFKAIWKGIKAIGKALSNKWVRIAIMVALVVITFASSTPLIIQNFAIAANGEITSSLALTTLGWVSAGLSAALSVGSVYSAAQDPPQDEEVIQVTTKCPGNPSPGTYPTPGPDPKKCPGRNSVGQPGLLESLIPIWGSGRSLIDHLQNGRWGWAALAAVDFAIDVTLVGGLAKLAIKGGVKVGAKISTKLAQRGGVSVGNSKYVRVVVKANPSEKSIGVIARGKRVLDIGKAQIKPGRPKQFHIRIGKGPHRGITGRRLK